MVGGSTLRKQIKASPQLSSKFSFSGRKMAELSLGRKNGYMSMSSPSPRSRPVCPSPNRPGLVRSALNGYGLPERRLTRRPTSQEFLRRALTPPPRRLALRWLNFRPTPSRLSVMSMA